MRPRISFTFPFWMSVLPAQGKCVWDANIAQKVYWKLYKFLCIIDCIYRLFKAEEVNLYDGRSWGGLVAAGGVIYSKLNRGLWQPGKIENQKYFRFWLKPAFCLSPSPLFLETPKCDLPKIPFWATFIILSVTVIVLNWEWRPLPHLLLFLFLPASLSAAY